MRLLAILPTVFLSAASFASVQVTCVCTKYVLNSSNELVLGTEELYTTDQWDLVVECNNNPDARLRSHLVTREHFNCRPIAKEDLSQPDSK